MHYGINKAIGLKGIRYTDHLIDLNKYLAMLPGSNINVKICMTELNRILLNSMHNKCKNQEHVQGFRCESITFKIAVNMFEVMEIS